MIHMATSLQARGETVSVVRLAAADLALGLGGPPTLVAVFASAWQPLSGVLGEVGRVFPGAAVIGASTAGQFTNGDTNGSVAFLALAGDVKAFGGFADGLARDTGRAVHDALSASPRSVDGYPHRAVIVLLDALADVSEEATVLLAEALGPETRVAGGTVGDDLQRGAPVVGAGGRVGGDALAVAVLFTKEPLGVGVCHGHKTLSGPLTITKASGATVFEVAGRPAWDVWREVTCDVAARRGIDPEKDVGGYLLQFEAGLVSGAVTKMRAPVGRRADGALSFACAMPEGATIRIQSEARPLIFSAREAARRAALQLDGGKVAGAVVFDCVCRSLLLGDRFGEAVRGIRDELGSAPLAGIEAYGEIALGADEMSGFHNATTVVLAIGG